jgi:hypothetical protein
MYEQSGRNELPRVDAVRKLSKASMIDASAVVRRRSGGERRRSSWACSQSFRGAGHVDGSELLAGSNIAEQVTSVSAEPLPGLPKQTWKFASCVLPGLGMSRTNREANCRPEENT